MICRDMPGLLLYSKDLFKGRVFTSDDFDIETIVREYGERVSELGKRYADKGFMPGIYQDSRPIITKE